MGEGAWGIWGGGGFVVVLLWFVYGVVVVVLLMFTSMERVLTTEGFCPAHNFRLTHFYKIL